MASNRQAHAAKSRGPAITLTPPMTIPSTSSKSNTISMEEWEAKAPLSDIELQSIALLQAASEKKPIPSKFLADNPNTQDVSRPGTPNIFARNAANRLLVAPTASSPGISTPILDRPGSSTPSSSRPGTPFRSSPHPTLISSNHALYPKQPIQTPQQFYDWFALIDRSVAHSQESHFRAHVANVKGHLERCDWLVERIDEVEKQVDEMMQEWQGVEDGGKSLKESCERVLKERDRLIELTEEIGSRLEYFQELEHATRLLNHPGESLVLQSDFLYMVERVDICIEYLKSHRHYKEADIYLLRFQQCMTRAMTLIKMYFVGSLRALSADVSRRLSEKEISQTAQYHLLYTRFHSTTPQIKPLLNELERRARAHPEELSALLEECHSAYLSTRRNLLVGRLIKEIKGLDLVGGDVVEITRAGCSYLKQVCTDEFNLFREFFNSGDEPLYQYLEKLCDYLYDDLRPRILHEPRLTALCEVCTVLQALMVLDTAVISDDEDDDDDEEGEQTHEGTERTMESLDELTLDLNRISNRGPNRRDSASAYSGVWGGGMSGRMARTGGQLHISHLLQMVLQDAQTRLFFKAQSVIQNEIKSYVPKADDLAYPDILIAAKKPTTGYEIKEKESLGAQVFKLTSTDQQDTWYPTLRKTVWVLGQLHDFVKPAIFDDIAQESFSLCRQSLVAAAENIKAKNPPQSALDGQLFLVQHLLILKEVASSLTFSGGTVGAFGGTGAATADVGVLGGFKTANGGMGNAGGPGGISLTGSGMTDALAMMLSGATSLFPDALFATLGMPKGEENIKDAKQAIDSELRRACEDLITSCSLPISQPLESWTTRLQKFINTSLPPPETLGAAVNVSNTPPLQQLLSSQPFAHPSAIITLDSQFRSLVNTTLRSSVNRLKLYLEDDRTVRVLLAHVQDRIMDEYAIFRDVVRRVYGNGNSDVVDAGEAGQLNLLAPVAARRLLREACGELDSTTDDEDGGRTVLRIGSSASGSGFSSAGPSAS